jgi:5'-deoxynucleotidase YfbR-like HD superfamily hydrolase
MDLIKEEIKGNYELLKKLHQRLQGGHVVRYHTRPDVGNTQTNATHSWRAMVILTTLWPDIRKKAVVWLLYHDVAEAELGDLPATVKWKYEDIATAYKKREREYEKKLQLPYAFEELSQEEQNKVRMADMLELVFHCKRQMQLGNTLAEPIYLKGREYLFSKFKEDPNFEVVESILVEVN